LHFWKKDMKFEGVNAPKGRIIECLVAAFATDPLPQQNIDLNQRALPRCRSAKKSPFHA
jgi:hypothetical protein